LSIENNIILELSTQFTFQNIKYLNGNISNSNLYH